VKPAAERGDDDGERVAQGPGALARGLGGVGDLPRRDDGVQVVLHADSIGHDGLLVKIRY
jgi:hypothetical protein